jgi:hypothetical protein
MEAGPLQSWLWNDVGVLNAKSMICVHEASESDQNSGGYGSSGDSSGAEEINDRESCDDTDRGHSSTAVLSNVEF